MKVSETKNQASELIQQQYKLQEKTASGHEKKVSGKGTPEEKVSLSAKAKDINQALVDAVAAFRGNRDQEDDLTLVVAKMAEAC